MAMEFNHVFLVGNLTRDPEIRYLASGSAVTEFDIASNRRYRSKTGEQVEETLFIRVTTFGKTAEICGEYLKKGSAILVDGRLKQDTWEKDGQKRSRIGIVANTVQFFPRSSGDQKSFGGRNSSAQDSSGPPEIDINDNPTDDEIPF